MCSYRIGITNFKLCFYRIRIIGWIYLKGERGEEINRSQLVAECGVFWGSEEASSIIGTTAVGVEREEFIFGKLKTNLKLWQI